MDLLEQLYRIFLLIYAIFFVGVSASPPVTPVPTVPPANTRVVPTVIETVETIVNGTDNATVQVVLSGYQPDGCEAPLQIVQQIEGSTVRVRIFRELPVDAICPEMIVSYNATLTLPGTFTPGTYTVIVNDKSAPFTVEGSSTTPTATVLHGIDFAQAVFIEPYPFQVMLEVQGYQPDGCSYPVQITQSRTGSQINVRIFRQLPGDILCTQQIIPYNNSIPLEGPFDPTVMYTVDVNGTTTQFTTGPAPEPTAVPGGSVSQPIIIDSVNALLLESYPVQIHLSVTGSIPDGCDYPVQIQQIRSGNTVTVNIFRMVDPAALCPMIARTFEQTIPLDGGFETGTYTIIVNQQTITVTI